MRFLSIFFRFLATAIIGGLLFVVIGREIWLFVGAQQVGRQAQRLTQVARWQPFYSNCRPELALQADLPFRGIQLRFEDQSNYVTEIDCVGQQPYEVDTFSLPMGVKKTTGSAGFFFDPVSQVLSGEVTLSFFGQSRVVFADGLDAGQQWGVSDVRSDLPVSMCAGHGLKCCDAVESQGQGMPMSAGVLDCPGSCYDSCLSRPVLLSFRSDQGLTQERVVTLAGQDQFVVFAYTFDARDSIVQEVTIDYGDGTQDVASTSAGQFEKSFSCPTSNACEFVVKLRATDARGVTSADTRLSAIRVVLNPTLVR